MMEPGSIPQVKAALDAAGVNSVTHKNIVQEAVSRHLALKAKPEEVAKNWAKELTAWIAGDGQSISATATITIEEELARYFMTD